MYDMTTITDESLDSLFVAAFPLVPVPVTLEERLATLIRKVEKDELYQEDAEPGRSGQSATKGR